MHNQETATYFLRFSFYLAQHTLQEYCQYLSILIIKPYLESKGLSGDYTKNILKQKYLVKVCYQPCHILEHKKFRCK